MSVIKDILAILEGKRTYLMAVAYAIDAFGTSLGWWPEATVRTAIEQSLMFIFLRAGLKKE